MRNLLIMDAGTRYCRNFIARIATLWLIFVLKNGYLSYAILNWLVREKFETEQ
ncbi:hypothetical protein CDL15_Pgr017446 [Punica granatum]|uniref:Uncharacterized protein n=1 Tax=Punica granatum TaxID=22663 RepID=A0A218W5E8_PUNGR|nr:hypothetical protein CDL15_Pgr017446 [Punica granatum]